MKKGLEVWGWGLVAALYAYAQAPVLDLRPAACQGTPEKPKISGFVPATVLVAGVETKVSVPVCLAIGAGLVVNMSAEGGPALEAVVQPAKLPNLVTETFYLSTMIPAIQQDQTEVTVTLSKLPATNTLLFALRKSSSPAVGTYAILPLGSTASRQLKFALLPFPWPLTADDTITVVYQTWESNP